MRNKLIALALAFASIASTSFTVAASNNRTAMEALAIKCVSADSAEAESAIAALRAEGPAGLQAFLSAHADKLKDHHLDLSSPVSERADPEWDRLRAAMDQLCEQKDCYGSRLYWHTDIEQAKAAARASGKPILSLRLLGNLDEDLSCANSRFFRITLYANQGVSDYLRENFVLHWKSVRPVPKVTIDFGNGMKLERTLTGNSIHYVLDSEGRVVDGLPGLYGAKAFLQGLRRAEDVMKQAAGRDNKDREAILVKYHQGRIKEIAAEMNAAFAKVGLIDPSGNATGEDGKKLPTAVQAARMVVSKLGVERPLLRGLARGSVLQIRPEDVAWMRVGEALLAEARLDDKSRALMRNKNPQGFGSPQIFQYAVAMLERTIAADTARNEYLFHARIHEWLTYDNMANDVERLNDTVYATLFLTPNSDIWLGLHPTEVFTGIENDGVKK
ncbi:MAG TPA: hypothetical protein VKA70_17350 [Blastocatellia bacterium]|nr:hypothetical protein [Blastocatellia bacterium]